MDENCALARLLPSSSVDNLLKIDAGLSEIFKTWLDSTHFRAKTAARSCLTLQEL
jgi:hypothetical protein